MESGCESCGWAAAVVAMLSFGSFGVPIKSPTCSRLNVDPLVFQTYKSGVCFLSAAVILFVTGHPFHYTPWGLLSAAFWVPGGVATVQAVKFAGLALAIAIGNSLIALVSFGWGIFVFQEEIHSRLWASVAVGMMVLGFSGMSYFSTRKATTAEENRELVQLRHVGTPGRQQLSDQCLMNPYEDYPTTSIPKCPSSGEPFQLIEEARTIDAVSKEIHDFESKTFHCASNQPAEVDQEGGGLRHRQVQHVVHHHTNEMVHSPRNVTILQAVPDLAVPLPSRSFFFFELSPQSSNPRPSDPLVHWGNTTLSRRQVGIALAVFNGCYGGSIMAPMKLCPDPTVTAGIGYVWSFSIGAVLVTAVLWVLRYMWILADTRSFQGAYKVLPSMHLEELWKPGGLSGILWSIGNLFSILAVDNLGEGVGYCVCQASMLISGLWGIFYFHEVKGSSAISKWFLSALLTVCGILLLSYEHHEA